MKVIYVQYLTPSVARCWTSWLLSKSEGKKEEVHKGTVERFVASLIISCINGVIMSLYFWTVSTAML